MKKVFCFVSYVLLAGGMVSCQKPDSTLSDEEKKQIHADVKQMLHDYVTAIKNDGLHAEFHYLDQSSDFFWVPPGYETSISYDSVAAVLNANASLFKSVENSYDTLVIVPLKKDLASYTAVMTSVITDTADRASTMRLIESGLVIKRESGWKLQCGQTSVINPKD